MLANHQLADLRQRIASLTASDHRTTTFDALARSWLDGVRHALKPASISRREVCITGLAPFFRAASARSISAAHCDKWLERRGNGLSPSSFAQELDTLRLILDHAVKRGLLLDNPALAIKRRKLISKRIVIPTRRQFQAIIAAIRDAEGAFGSQGKGKHGADLVELLAYSGCRLREATALRWVDVDFAHNTLTVTGGERGTKNGESRMIPTAPALRDLLLRLQDSTAPQPTDPISPIHDAKKCLDTACRKLGFPHFTHHDFRHFFATTCIESGVDIPTISRWLGHKDGGALAMKVYRHLRQEHSFAMIKRVDFGTAPHAQNVIPIAAQAFSDPQRRAARGRWPTAPRGR
jgi:integrase